MMQSISEKYGLTRKDYVHTSRTIYNKEVSVSAYSAGENNRYVITGVWEIPLSRGILVFIGKNPSKAGCVVNGKFHKSDKTFTIMVKIAIANNYSGIICLNMSSFICTKYDSKTIENISHINVNKDIIKTILKECLDVYCYWGGLPGVLKKIMLSFVVNELRLLNLKLYCSIVNKDNIPRHIGRKTYYDGKLSVFTV
jgi:hypothetical protein